MQITVRGDLSIPDLRKAINEKLHELEERYAIGYSAGATLYLNPVDEDGEVVSARGTDGRTVRKMVSQGPYRSVGDELKI